MRKFLLGLAVVSCLLVPAWPARADLQGSLLQEYATTAASSTYAINEDSGKHLTDILNNSNIKVICLQANYDKYDPTWTPRLMEWVRQGGSLWFYDARLAPQFGFEQFELRGEQFRGQAENGEIGKTNFAGRAVMVYPFQSHAVTTGVASVAAFLPLLDRERDIYGAVVPKEGVSTLLQFAADSPALAALRREGYGTVVFKPLLWEKTLSGERFQRNLIDYCAGYGVPGVGGEGRVGEQLSDKRQYVSGSQQDVIALALDKKEGGAQGAAKAEDDPVAQARSAMQAASGDVMTKSDAKEPHPDATAEVETFDRLIVYGNDEPRCGKVETWQFKFEGGSSSHTFTPEDLSSIEIGEYGNLDKAILKDGRTITGFLLTNVITIRTDNGSFSCKKGDMKKLEFGVPK